MKGKALFFKRLYLFNQTSGNIGSAGTVLKTILFRPL
jgi:hypothetical protein